MKQLVQCLIDWIDQLHASGQAVIAMRALASETLKRIESKDPQQRQFDAMDLAQAADPSREWDYDLAKQWLNRANLPKFVDARMVDLSEYFRLAGHGEILMPQKSETSGRHRAYWFLAVRQLPPAHADSTDSALVGDDTGEEPGDSIGRAEELVYEYSPSQQLRLGPLGWILLGRKGNTPTKSARGVLWAGMAMLFGLVFLAIVFVLWGMTRMQRPLTAGDLASLVMLLVTGAAVWWLWARPLIWLAEDRIIPAPDLIAAMSEDPCQLEMPKEGQARYIRLVRYSGVCPVCAGRIELRYGSGHESRRLFGCCGEAPQEHIFSFDRVTRKGRLIRTNSR